MKRKTLLLLFAVLLPFFPVKGEEPDAGLRLNAHTHLAEKRTSLILDNGKGIALKQNLSVAFDMLIRKESSYFGFVFRIITNTERNIDLILSLDKQYKPFPELIIGDNTYPIAQSIQTGIWFPLNISFDEKKECICFTYGNSTFDIPFSFEQVKDIFISFGKCSHGKFTSTDVAPVNIKNIEIKEGNEVIRYWSLDRHCGDVCYDQISGKQAVAENPHWEIDEHCTWEKIGTIPIDNKVQVAFDQKNTMLYIVPDESRVIAFDIKAMQKKEIKVKSGFPAAGNFSQLVMDTLHNRLISFNLNDEKISFFSFADSSWTSKEEPSYESAFWHHSLLFSISNDSSIFTFGGYGGFKYNNILVQINPFKNAWQKHVVESIYPRYSVATAIVDDDIYIYGGRGSKTGRQELGTEYMYDLHKLNIETGKTTHVGDFAIDGLTYLPAENMVFNQLDSCFYILTDWGGGQLMKLSLREKKVSLIGNGLSDKMSSLHLYRNLFYDPLKAKIYAIYDKTSQDGNGIKSIAVYSMKYPPLLVSDTVQSAIVNPVSYFNCAFMGIFIILIVVLLSLFYFRRRKKQRKCDLIQAQKQEKEELPDLGRQNICLLGGLSIIDRNGKNITGDFSPTLRNLLLVLILYSNSSKKGIISSKLDELLWGDKDENSARNNRNVSIRKLRILLETIGDVSITTSNNYWRISFGEDVFCDYCLLMSFLQNFKDLEDEVSFQKFLNLVSLGALLPNIQADWIDPFKSELSSVLIDVLLEVAQKENYNRNNKMIIRIADAIFFNDPLNEEALQLKCVALFNSGKTGLAKSIYDNFCKTYKILLGDQYEKTFNQIIEG